MQAGRMVGMTCSMELTDEREYLQPFDLTLEEPVSVCFRRRKKGPWRTSWWRSWRLSAGTSAWRGAWGAAWAGARPRACPTARNASPRWRWWPCSASPLPDAAEVPTTTRASLSLCLCVDGAMCVWCPLECAIVGEMVEHVNVSYAFFFV